MASAGLLLRLAIILAYAAICIGIAAHLRRRGMGRIGLAFFALFAIYLYAVLDFTLFQYQSLVLLRLFEPNLILQGLDSGDRVNLVPLLRLTREDVGTSVLNVVLMIPFGLGLPFVTRLPLRRVILAGAAFSLLIEFVQFLTGAIAGIAFRIADVNDVLFNTTGTAIGTLLFVGVVPFCRGFPSDGLRPGAHVLRYVTTRPQARRPARRTSPRSAASTDGAA